MRFSIIIPVFNRPDEVEELLQSLTAQTVSDFEVIVVEDGSSIPCKEVCEHFSDSLDLHYYNKKNSGPGQSRNFGAERSKGEYLIILDSDVVLPEGYLAAIESELDATNADAFGGPDRAHSSFTDVQKAISYSMTSFFTTGGIRGGKKKLDKFYPRSFNMGIRRDIFLRLGGFSKIIGTILQIFVVPTLFVIFQSLQEKISPLKFEDEENAEVAAELAQYAHAKPVDYEIEK